MRAMERTGMIAAVHRSVAVEVGTVLAGAAVLAGASRLALPVGPVPLTAQTLAVLLLGALLGAKRGTASVVTFLLAGAAGAPIFAYGGGAGYLLGPTGGYLVGFIPAAYLAGDLVERGWGRSLSGALLAMGIADATIFACGLTWLGAWAWGSGLMPMERVLTEGLWWCVPGEAIKVVLAAMIVSGGHRPRRPRLSA